ncbi:MAG TPA: serine hydrolase [Chthoniobacterales bacterium]|nr:serine hydrolase [Chthoniobacterales bacterium]
MITKNLARLALLAFAISTFAAEPAASPDQNRARTTRIENGLLPAVIVKGEPRPTMSISDRMAHYKVPGVSIAVINNGAIEWAAGYGVTEAGQSPPVTAETIFQAASISKPVFAMGALSLVEKRQLDLDEDVNLKLKSWKVPANEFTKEKKVTLRTLLNHSAGTTVHGFRGYGADEPVPSLLDVLDGRKPPANSDPVRVDTVPGTKWRYSGGGITIAQLLVMDVSGKPFPQFMRETVLDKLGMNQSTYEQPLPKDWTARAAAAHDRSGAIVKGRWHTYPEAAAAGLWTTPADLALFAIEIQNARAGKSNQVLSRTMTAEMLEPIRGGFGLGIESKGKGRSATFSHGGSNEGFRTQMFAYLETGQGAVVMTNGENGSPLIDEIMRGIAAEYGWPDYKVGERAIAKIDPKLYASYAGEYRTRNSSLNVAVEGDRLFVKADPLGPDRLELLPESETKFFVTAADVAFTFRKDESGKVTEIVVEPASASPVTAKRVN